MFSLTVQEAQVAVFKALSHSTRLSIVEILASEGAKSVTELTERLEFDQSTISKHLRVLRSARIVKSTKEGLNVMCELNLKCVYQFMKCVESVLLNSKSKNDCGMKCGVSRK